LTDSPGPSGNADVIAESFVLPQNFPPHVESALAEKSLTSRSMSAFITTVARAVFAIKRFPTTREYDTVSRLVVQRYPFLKSPLGQGFEHLTLGFKNRLKSFRRNRATPGSVSSPSNPRKKQKILTPAATDGEDETSYRRHVGSMVAEFKKRSPNQQFVEQLMKITFTQRRQTILNCPQTAAQILSECPFLSVFDDVCHFIKYTHDSCEKACYWF
jgi:hypothetical protein